MASGTKGVGKAKDSNPKTRVARNLATQPREFKIGGKWYKWNARGTQGDTLDVTGVDLTGFERYFEIKER
ncbi:MAG: hypothetical protein HDQ88_03610 [Clostridia bacterium]|nr:hypothetical protein [Clostridia bacterium]